MLQMQPFQNVMLLIDQERDIVSACIGCILFLFLSSNKVRQTEQPISDRIFMLLSIYRSNQPPTDLKKLMN